MHNTPSEDVRSFIDCCREKGLKITPQRIALYKIISDEKTHPSAKEVYDKIVKEYPHISIDTVNRSLNQFAELGLVDIVEGYGEPRRFDPDRATHHHAHCISCGNIIDFHNTQFDDLEVPEDIAGNFSILSKRVVINGICGNCADSRKS